MVPRPLPDLEPMNKGGTYRRPIWHRNKINLFKYAKFPPTWKDFFSFDGFWSGWFYGFVSGMYIGACAILIILATLHLLIWGGFIVK
jgi:hypothetical protein